MTNKLQNVNNIFLSQTNHFIYFCTYVHQNSTNALQSFRLFICWNFSFLSLLVLSNINCLDYIYNRSCNVSKSYNHHHVLKFRIQKIKLKYCLIVRYNQLYNQHCIQQFYLRRIINGIHFINCIHPELSSFSAFSRKRVAIIIYSLIQFFKLIFLTQ